MTKTLGYHGEDRPPGVAVPGASSGTRARRSPFAGGTGDMAKIGANTTGFLRIVFRVSRQNILHRG